MEIISSLIIIGLVGIVVFLALQLFRKGGSGGDNIHQLLQQLNQQQAQQQQETARLVLQQLNRQQEAQERSSGIVHSRLDQATKVVSEVQGKLLQLEEANKRIFDLGKDISGLQQILQAPKLRGGMGEIWLADLINQIIPAGHFQMQYRFKSGEICDAVIFLRDGLLLSIDSKFSLENFVRMLESPESEKAVHTKQFASDVKKRIDEIAKKYILPGEGTLEFAFMYVPAENVYYQAFIQGEDLQLLNYAFSKKVIPVSPSSFYAYLQVITLGLRSFQIEQSAKEIQKNLTGLHGEFSRFQEVYAKVGVHLRHAQQSYDATDKRIDRVNQKFSQITHAEQAILEETSETLTLDNE